MFLYWSSWSIKLVRGNVSSSGSKLMWICSFSMGKIWAKDEWVHAW